MLRASVVNAYMTLVLVSSYVLGGSHYVCKIYMGLDKGYVYHAHISGIWVISILSGAVQHRDPKRYPHFENYPHNPSNDHP